MVKISDYRGSSQSSGKVERKAVVGQKCPIIIEGFHRRKRRIDLTACIILSERPREDFHHSVIIDIHHDRLLRYVTFVNQTSPARDYGAIAQQPIVVDVDNDG